MDLHGAVVTVHRGRGLTVTRRSRRWPRARGGRPERQSHTGSNQRRTGNEGEIRTQGNKGHSMPPLVEELGPYRTIAGDRVTVTPSLSPSSSAQTPASPEPDPCRVLITASLTNLSGLVITEDIVAVRPVSHSWSCPTRLRRSRTPVTAPSRHAWCMAFPWSVAPNLAAGQPPLARHVCRAGPSGCSCRAPPACEHRHRPGQGADIGDRVAVDDEQVGVIPRPAAGPCCPPGRPRPRPARSPTPARRRRSRRLQPGKLPRRAAGRAAWRRQFGRLAEHLSTDLLQYGAVDAGGLSRGDRVLLVMSPARLLVSA